MFNAGDCGALPGAIVSQKGERIQRSGRVLKWCIAAFSALVSIGICIIVANVVIDQRDSVARLAKENASNLSEAFGEQARLVLNGLAAAMEPLKLQPTSANAQSVIFEWTKNFSSPAGTSAQVDVFGADGTLLASARQDGLPRSKFSTTELIRGHRESADRGLFIGRPFLDRSSGQFVLQATMRRDAPDGSFGGMIVFSLNPEVLTPLHRRITLGRSGSIALVGTDGFIRARFTGTAGMDAQELGTSIAGAKAVTDAAVTESGGYPNASVVDGITRWFHWRRVSGYPLIVVVGIGQAESLAPANRRGTTVMVLGAVTLVLALMMVGLLNREISQQANYEIAQQHESEKLKALNESLTRQRSELLATSAELAGERLKLREANSELDLAMQRAEEANRVKSSFLANVSHELRTPLNAILGFSEIIREKMFGNDLARYSDRAEDIHSSGLHLLRIINEILDISKIEAGKFELRETEISLDEIVDASLIAVASQADTGGVNLLLDHPHNRIFLRGDKTRLTQIIINLLSNAVKFTPAGGSVTVVAEENPDHGVSIAISDTGIGMTAEEIDKAFELFGQVDDRLARFSDGTGLGLPLAAQLAELHDGTIQVQSTPGIGTRATLVLPPARVTIGVTFPEVVHPVLMSADITKRH